MPVIYNFQGWKKIETSCNQHAWMEDIIIALVHHEVRSFDNYQNFWLKRNNITIYFDWYCFFLWFQNCKKVENQIFCSIIQDWYCFFLCFWVLWIHCIPFCWNTFYCWFRHWTQWVQVFIIFSGACQDFSFNFSSFYNMAWFLEDEGVFNIVNHQLRCALL